MTNSAVKQELFDQCRAYVTQKLGTVQNQIRDVQEGLTSETKSSAGDKHETGRAMLQLEREKLGHQLADIENTKANLQKIEPSAVSKSVILGSVVFTTEANYYIAVSAGTLTIDGQSFYAISPNTPIGLLLMGKVIGDQVYFREAGFEILKVL
jgi:transcription elongation GreA/GreB family factor